MAFNLAGGTNPTSSESAFIEIWNNKMCSFSSNARHMQIPLYCISAQTGKEERDITIHTSGVNQTTKPLTPGCKRGGLCIFFRNKII